MAYTYILPQGNRSTQQYDSITNKLYQYIYKYIYINININISVTTTTNTNTIIGSYVLYNINELSSSNYDNSSNDSTTLMLYNTISNRLIIMLLSQLYIIQIDLVYSSSDTIIIHSRSSCYGVSCELPLQHRCIVSTFCTMTRIKMYEKKRTPRNRTQA